MQEILDADDTPLKDHHGQQMARDIVQFVPFREVMEKDGLNGCVVWLHRVPYRQSVSIYKLYICVGPFESIIYAVNRIGLLMHNPSPWSSRVFLSI